MDELLCMAHDRNKLPLEMSFEAYDDGQRESFHHTIIPSDVLAEYDSSYENSFMSVTSRADDNLVMLDRFGTSFASSSAPNYPVLLARWEVEHGDNVESLDITVPQIQQSGCKPFRSASFMDVLAHTSIADTVKRYGSLKREGMLQSVSNEISKVFTDVTGFDMIPYPDGSQSPLSVVRSDGSLLPLYSYGDGVQKWFYTLGAMSLYKNSILCIDEIDVGLHPKAHSVFASSIVKTAERNNIQVFATTHNIEFVESLLTTIVTAGVDTSDLVRIITLREIDGVVRMRNLSASEALKAREAFNLELR
jgi:hypothetical protein